MKGGRAAQGGGQSWGVAASGSWAEPELGAGVGDGAHGEGRD